MSYEIEYDMQDLPKTVGKPRKASPWAILAVVLCLLLALGIKTLSLPWVQEVLLPGDPAVTAAALENMAQNLKNGDSLLEAVTAFCQEIVRNAS